MKVEHTEVQSARDDKILIPWLVQFYKGKQSPPCHLGSTWLHTDAANEPLLSHCIGLRFQITHESRKLAGLAREAASVIATY
jgi:hypothetical protein